MLTDRTARRETGFSLVELTVAMAIGLFLMSALIWVFAELVRASHHQLKTAHLDQMLVSAMHVMTGELRRAGYWSRAWKTLDGGAANGFAPIHVVGTDCLLYSYDREKRNPDGQPGPDDQHGFRVANGALQIKTSDDRCGPTTCDVCTTGNWSALTDSQTILIEHAAFEHAVREQPFNSGVSSVRVRELRIELSGMLRRDPAITRTLRTIVNVRNDEIR
jgi:type II secretory pathway component PulJ